MTISSRWCAGVLRAAAAALGLVGSVLQATAETMSFNLPPGPAETSLKRFSTQSGLEVVFATKLVSGVTTPEVKGDYAPDDALAQLLAGTPLVAKPDGRTGAIVISRTPSVPNAPRAAPTTSDRPESRNEIKDGVLRLETFEVMGSKLLNMDIPRSRDDAQPYVIFDRETIDRSGAVTMEEFLKHHLPMNGEAFSGAQGGITTGMASSINLRGLGTGQTLILVDGHRTAGFMGGNQGVQQADLNGIPLSAVERIEVLPTTASGIYGGSATGGVVNVILRRDYSGIELGLTYGNTFDTDVAYRRVDLSGGVTLASGRTNLIFAASYSDQNELLFQDRDFVARGRAQVIANAAGDFQAANYLGIRPPLGTTANILSATGANLQLKDGTALNSPITFAPAGYGGRVADQGQALVANAGRYNLTAPQNARIGGGALRSLLNNPTLKSGHVTVRHQFGPAVQAFLETGASRNTGYFRSNAAVTASQITLPAANPNNPFLQNIIVTVPILGLDDVLTTTNQSKRAVGGLIFKLPGEWQLGTDYTWTETRFSYQQPRSLSGAQSVAITAGTLDPLRADAFNATTLAAYVLANPESSTVFKSTLQNAVARASGPVGNLPGGRPVVSTLVEQVAEKFGEGVVRSGVPGNDIIIPSRSQEVVSGYVETKLPLVSALNAFAGAKELELQIALRHDDYRVKGATSSLVGTAPVVRQTLALNSTNPTVGLRYRPLDAVVLRASYGEGFLPPSTMQLVPTQRIPLPAGAFVDPRRGGQASTAGAELISGGNGGLRPEESESWSAGAILTPPGLNGLRISVDYTRIEKTDNIAEIPGGAQGVVNNESLYPDRVVRAAAAPGDPFGVGVITRVDATLANIARALVEAYDVQVDYDHELGAFGRLGFTSVATWQTHYRTQLLSTQPLNENVGYSFTNPPKLKGNATLRWMHRGMTFGWTSRYVHSYIVGVPGTTLTPVAIRNQGNGGRVDAQTYHDIFAKLPLGRSKAGVLAHTELQLGINNLFNTRPPLDSISSLDLYYSQHGDPRLRNYRITLKKTF